jgi:NAD(P)-dependent dehydrogenase (short-subunit alcohol dehydrogenase family)
MKLSDKVVLITGTSPNIGGGIAESFAEAGAKVVAVDARIENAADCAAYINRTGGIALGHACDVTNEDQVRSVMTAAVDAFGRIDVLVNNAARFQRKGVLDMSLEEWNRQLAVILGGTFLCTKYAAQAMIRQGDGGAIINIVSTAGHQGDPGNIAYGTAKAGLLNFTRSAAMELIPHAIRVNSLTPTATDPSEQFERATRWGRTAAPPPGLEQIMSRYRRRSPMGKLPRPSDYGKAAVFLASDDAAMITATDLAVDAGALGSYWGWDPAATRE